MSEDSPWAKYEIDYHVERLRRDRLAAPKNSARSENRQRYLSNLGNLVSMGFNRSADRARGAWDQVQARFSRSSKPEEQCC